MQMEHHRGEVEFSKLGGTLSSSGSTIRVLAPSLPSRADRVLVESRNDVQLKFSGSQYGNPRKIKIGSRTRSARRRYVRQECSRRNASNAVRTRRLESGEKMDSWRPMRRPWEVVGLASGKGEGSASRQPPFYGPRRPPYSFCC